MNNGIIYPIVIELKVKKTKFSRRLLVVEQDRIKYYDVKETKMLLFEANIEDCEVFEKNANNKYVSDLHLISRSQ